jgi:hypothetical protein
MATLTTLKKNLDLPVKQFHFFELYGFFLNRYGEWKIEHNRKNSSGFGFKEL